MRDDLIRQRLQRMDAASRALAIGAMTAEELVALDHHWPSWAHDGQLEPAAGHAAGPAAGPDGAWRTWVMMAGRGFDKTRAGSEWVLEQVRAADTAGDPPPRIALVAATLHEARRVMVEGISGLLSVADGWIAGWQSSIGRLQFRGGAEANLFSGASPDGLRGPEHHLAWCDELAKWERPGDCWDMLQLGLRLGPRPRALITTTPRGGADLHRIIASPGTIVTGGRTVANPHLPPAFIAAVQAMYGGTRLGQQELDGKMPTDLPGALWTVEMIERSRIPPCAKRGEGDHPQDGGGASLFTNPAIPEAKPPPFLPQQWPVPG